MGILMGPRTHKPLRRRFKVLQHSEHGIGIAICPATHRVYRGLDLVIVFTNRTVLIKRIPMLMPHPVFKPESAALNAIHPDVIPPLTEDVGIRRGGIDGKHVAIPGRVVI